jgi:hypothetical protein
MGDESAVGAWLEAGAAIIGLWSGADPAALEPLVTARERLLTRIREREDAERSSLGAWVTDAARRAPGGRALWIGDAQVGQPPGFAWTTVPAGEPAAGALPAEAFRLVIALTPLAPERLARLVERGGIVAFELPGGEVADLPGRLASLGLRVQDLGSAADGVARAIARREDA